MASSSHPHVATSLPNTPTPQASPSHAEADKENISLPYTPTSTSTSGALPPRRPPSGQHRKASSLSTPRPTSQSASRPLSLRDSQVLSLTSDHLKASELEDREKGGKPDSVMVTPPQNLPPSPPLTSQETDEDGDIEAYVDTEEATHGESHEQEEDVTDGWQHRDAAMRRSLQIADNDHPLGEGLSGDVRVDADLEKGLRGPASRQRSQTSLDVDVADQSGVTKPFEVVRRPRRPTSPKPPHSSYYIGPPTGSTAFSTPPTGQIGVHHPREIVRIERDYGHGELVQFSSAYPLELQDRITPTQFLETINALNEGLIRAHSLAGACLDNTLAVLTLWMSTLVLESKYEREMKRMQRLVDALNAELYNPQGLHIIWPRKSAFLFLEIEYY